MVLDETGAVVEEAEMANEALEGIAERYAGNKAVLEARITILPAMIGWPSIST